MGEALRRKPPSGYTIGWFYLVRRVSTRKVVNQDVVDQLIGAFSIEKICLADLSVEEQQSKLATAEVVIATYGSDLLAHYFMNEGSHLIELNWNVQALPSNAAPYCSFLGIHYHLIACMTAEGGKKAMKKDSNFVVDIAALKELLERIIKGEKSLSAADRTDT